jgi:hypothetical protein
MMNLRSEHIALALAPYDAKVTHFAISAGAMDSVGRPAMQISRVDPHM